VNALPLRVAVFLTILCALAAIDLTACRSRPPSGPPDAIEFESDLATVDGLRRVKNTRVRAIYMKPGARLGNYSEVLIDPFMVTYKRFVGSDRMGHPKKAYTLDASTEVRLRQTLREVLVEELGGSRSFRVAETPGPQVLRLQGWISDLVVGHPKGRDPRSVGEVYLGEMTLILDVRDSETAEPLARVAGRFVMQRGRSRGYPERTDWIDVKRIIRRWAARLLDALDELHELAESPSASGDPSALGSPPTASLP
jgi:hypothetical protein